MKKLIIIPAYNESESIEKTVRDIIENAPSFDYVVIIIHDRYVKIMDLILLICQLIWE